MQVTMLFSNLKLDVSREDNEVAENLVTQVA